MKIADILRTLANNLEHAEGGTAATTYVAVSYV